MALWLILIASGAAVLLGCTAARKVFIHAEATSKQVVVDWLQASPCRLCGEELSRITASELTRALIRFRRTLKTGPAPEVWCVLCPHCHNELKVAERKGRAWHFDEVADS